MEEPRLREQQGDRDEHHCGRAARGHDERNEPDQVLGREDLCERQEAGDRGREGKGQATAGVAGPRVEEPHRGDGERLEH